MPLFQEYVAHGWRLCAINHGKKSPTYPKWQTRAVAEQLDINTAVGAGLLHAYSGTCALDIDSLDTARRWLLDHDVALDMLLSAPDAVQIDSGRSGHAKLLYALAQPLRTVQPPDSGLEFRCGTANGLSVQDILPPTIHPTIRKPYRWKYNEPLLADWRNLPPLPPQLRRVWTELIVEAPAETETATAPDEIEPNQLLEIYKFRLAGTDPDIIYPQWIDFGMIAHNSDPSDSGPFFTAWLEWSARGKKYKGRNDLLAHWRSFSNDKGKPLAKAAKILRGAAAPAEFDGATAETAMTTAQQFADQRRAQLQKFFDRIVYVKTQERYFDTVEQHLIGGHATLQDMYTWMMPVTNGRRQNPVKLLQESPGLRRDVRALAFHPGEGPLFQFRGETYANVFRPQFAEPLEPIPAERERLEWLFNRIEDEVVRKWLRQFFGHIVQRPGVKIRSAVLLWSRIKGNGKSTLLQALPARLIGKDYSQDVNYDALASNFNDYLEGKWHINLIEFRAGTRGERKAITDKIKPLISDATVPIVPKGRPAYTLPNYMFVTATSNDADAAHIEDGGHERRWTIHEMNAPVMTQEDIDYIYTSFLETDRAPGVLRHYFLHTDLTGFSPDAPAPKTASHAAMADASLPADVEYLMLANEERRGPFARDVVLLSEVLAYVHRNTSVRPNAHRIGMILAGEPFNGFSMRIRIGEARYRVFILRDIQRWRTATGEAIKAHIDGMDTLL